MGDCFISRRGLTYTPPSNKNFFGYDINLSEPNPQLRVYYPSEVNNYEYLPAKMEYATGVFDYGSWSNIAGNTFMPRPCMLNYDGTVAYYLDPNNYTKKEDGTPSDVANVNFPGNAMMEWGKLFTKRWETPDGIYHFRVCDIQLDNDYECWCNYDINNNQIPNFYTPIYFGSFDGTRLRSISGQGNMVNQTRQVEIARAQANGADYYTETFGDRLLIQDLLTLMAKSTDGQNAYGKGVCGGGSAIGQGTMNTKGLFWGANNQTSGVKVFGMENWWGNIWRAVAGWIYTSGIQKVKITRGVKDGSSAIDYNLTGDGYQSIPSSTLSGTSGSYISATLSTDFGRLPVRVNGSGSTYEPDALWFPAVSNAVNYVVVGHDTTQQYQPGPFCGYLSLSATAAGAANNGAALSCKPSAN